MGSLTKAHSLVLQPGPSSPRLVGGRGGVPHIQTKVGRPCELSEITDEAARVSMRRLPAS